LSEYSFDTFRAEIVSLRLAHAGDGSRQALLDRLEAWGQELEATLA
jgi:exodeoxyribonuclease-1